MEDLNFEIERKLLIEYPDSSFLEKCTAKYEIIQTYLLSPEGGELRVRRRRQGDKVEYFKTEKRKVSEVKRVEIENVISEEEYLSLLEEADPSCHPVEKTRYCYPYLERILEIDVYPFWQDQAILEIELESEDEGINIPPEIKVIREVTGVTEYKNTYFARNKKTT